MNSSKHPVGIEVRDNSIRIAFNYKGQRCRPTLKGLKSTPRNIKFAEQKRNTVLYEINQGSFDYSSHFPDCPKAKLFSPDTHGVLIESATGKWLNYKELTTAYATFKNYKSKAKSHVIPKWGTRNIRTIKASEIRDWVTGELGHLKNKTINEILIVMRGVFADYSLDNDSFKNPFDHIKNLIVVHDEPDPFTRDEIVRIIAAPTRRVQEINMIEFAFWSGLSVSEFIALAWEDIDLEKGVVRVNRAKVNGKWKVPKTKARRREVELLLEARNALNRQLEHTYMLNDIEISVMQEDNKTIKKERITPVFLNSNTGQPHSSDMPVRDRFFKAHLKKAKVRYRGPNHCRHTFASQMLTINMPKEWIVKQLGHTSTAMLDKHYGKWMTEDAPGMAAMASEKLKMPQGCPREKEIAYK